MEIIDDNGAQVFVPEEKMGCQGSGSSVITTSAATGSTASARIASEMTASERKQYPLVSGCLDYFPDALMEVAHCSWVGNEQHNPGMPLHWDRSKSTDEADALARHLKDRGTLDTDGVRHSAKVAWRALALLQKEIESERKA
jgi:hypothetical protein